MTIRRTTTTKQIMQYMQDELSVYERIIIRRLAYSGEMCIKQAREFGSYKDQTGNLRSSTGYVIVKNGQIIEGSGFNKVPPKKIYPGDSYIGAEEVHSFAQKLASEFPRGIVLIVVAGMNYAAHVEAKGYDVLTSSEILANRIVPQMLNQLGLYKK